MRFIKWADLRLGSVGNMDTIVAILKNDDHELAETLRLTSFHKRQKTILAIPKGKVEKFRKVANKFGKNSYFYLMTYDETEKNNDWFSFMTFYHTFDIVMNRIRFMKNGIAIEDYDMQGIKIIATSENWEPFTSHSDCDEKGRNCNNSGFLVDKMKIWGKRFNFTWDIMAGYNGDWGLFPVSGE